MPICLSACLFACLSFFLSVMVSCYSQLLLRARVHPYSLGSFVRLGMSRTKLNGKFLTEYLREALSNIHFDLDLFIFKHHITTVIALPWSLHRYLHNPIMKDSCGPHLSSDMKASVPYGSPFGSYVCMYELAS